jgi:hypothetical protein
MFNSCKSLRSGGVCPLVAINRNSCASSLVSYAFLIVQVSSLNTLYYWVTKQQVESVMQQIEEEIMVIQQNIVGQLRCKNF